MTAPCYICNNLVITHIVNISKLFGDTLIGIDGWLLCESCTLAIQKGMGDLGYDNRSNNEPKPESLSGCGGRKSDNETLPSPNVRRNRRHTHKSKSDSSTINRRRKAKRKR